MHIAVLLIGCFFLMNSSRSDDSWNVEFGTGSGWSSGFQILLENTNHYDYIERDFSEAGECVGQFDPADFRSIRLLVDAILREEHPVKLARPEGGCSDETTYYIKVEQGVSGQIVAEYGFSSIHFCRAINFPESVSNLALKLARLGATKLKNKCLREMALNPSKKPGLGPQ